MSLLLRDSFIYNGNPQPGATVYGWRSTRTWPAGWPPAQGAAPPSGTADAGPVTTGTAYGDAGAFELPVPDDTTGWTVQVVYNGVSYWKNYSPGYVDGIGGGVVTSLTNFGGDLSGNPPNLTVVGIHGVSITGPAPGAGYSPVTTSATGASWQLSPTGPTGSLGPTGSTGATGVTGPTGPNPGLALIREWAIQGAPVATSTDENPYPAFGPIPIPAGHSVTLHAASGFAIGASSPPTFKIRRYTAGAWADIAGFGTTGNPFTCATTGDGSFTAPGDIALADGDALGLWVVGAGAGVVSCRFTLWVNQT